MVWGPFGHRLLEPHNNKAEERSCAFVREAAQSFSSKRYETRWACWTADQGPWCPQFDAKVRFGVLRPCN